MKSKNKLINKNKLLIAGTSLMLIGGIALLTTGISCSMKPEKPIEIDKEILSKNLLSINIDNYHQYFDNANEKPDKENTGKMSNETFAKLANIDVKYLEWFKLEKSEEKKENDQYIDKGFLRLNFEIKLKNKESSIRIDDVLTGMYDPNSKYNYSFIENNKNFWAGSLGTYNYIKSFKYSQDTKIIYIPWKIESIFSSVNVDYPEAKIDFRFSQVFSFPLGALRNQNFKELDFSGSKYFTFTDNGMDKNTNVFRNNSSLEVVNFSNTPIIAIQGQAFVDNVKLKKVLFDGCKDLKELKWSSFSGCTSLETLDFSDSPITIVSDSAFSGCTSLKTIYVKDETSKEVFEQSLKAANLTNCQVIIKE